jgi:hypothetical protein
MRCKYLDGVLGPIALFTTMEPILEECSRNLNQCLDAWGVSLRLIQRQAISYTGAPHGTEMTRQIGSFWSLKSHDSDLKCVLQQ